MSLNKFLTFLRLPFREKILVPRAFVCLVRIRKLTGGNSFSQVLSRVKTPVLPDREKSGPDPYRICWIIDRCADVLGKGYNCLPRALAGYVLCRRRGWDVVPRIGTRRISPKAPFEAHAWLEYGGDVIMGYLPGLSLFVPFDDLKDDYL